MQLAAEGRSGVLGNAHIMPGADDWTKTLPESLLVSLVQLCRQTLRQNPDRIFNAGPGSGVIDDLLRLDSWGGRPIEDIDDQPGRATRDDRIDVPHNPPGREGRRHRRRLRAVWHCRLHAGAHRLLEFSEGHSRRCFTNAHTGRSSRCRNIEFWSQGQCGR